MGFPINPPNEPLVDENRRVKNSWYRFFLAIQQMVGGPTNPFDDMGLMAAPAQIPTDSDLALLAPPVAVPFVPTPISRAKLRFVA